MNARMKISIEELLRRYPQLHCAGAVDSGALVSEGCSAPAHSQAIVEIEQHRVVCDAGGQ